MYYCKIIDFSKTVPGVVVVHYDVCRTDDDSVVIPNATKAFYGVRDTETGERADASKQQRSAVFKDEVDAYFAQIIADMEAADQDYDDLKDVFIGYRYPAAKTGGARES